MSNPWVPPYFGSWEKLVNELLHDPTLGGGGTPHHPLTHLQDYRGNAGPRPEPWRNAGPSPDPWRTAVEFLVSNVSLRVAAQQLPNSEARETVIREVDQTISRFLDDFCGTPPRTPWPWPWPGPPPWVFTMVSEITVIANTLQEGSLRNELQQLGGQMLQKSLNASR